MVAVRLDGRLDELVLRLEVVVDVAHGDVGRARDVGQGRLLDPLLVQHTHGGAREPFPLPRPG